MSKDVIRPLTSAVADLPTYYTGLVLGVVKALSGPPRIASVMAERFKMALDTTLNVPLVRVPDSRQMTRTRVVNVDRSCTPLEAFKATGRVLHLDSEVMDSVPVCTERVVSMSFINLGKLVRTEKLDEELAQYGKKLICDPVALAALSIAEPDFDDSHPYCTLWRDSHGNWCMVSFSVWLGERTAEVSYCGTFCGQTDWFPVEDMIAES